MLKWFSAGEDSIEPEKFNNVISGLQQLYKKNVLQIEKDYRFHQFYSPLLTDGDFDAAPMVMLLGQYSTGKTTFIKHLLEREYPGMRIGPEPTTDKFVAIMNSNRDQIIPGNAAAVDSTKPFSQLTIFGNAFLSRFECVLMSSALLHKITLIDTPGVLSGSKQTSRGYDFEGVVRWFAERVDLILLIFDAHKLDISDEFKRCIHAIRGNDIKIRIILNKADMVSTQQLMRIYGALMWSLGKIIETPEIARVYIGSFWDQSLANDENRKLFESEANDLYSILGQLPQNATIRKLNDFIKRIKLVKVHARLLNYLRKQMPMWGRENKKKQLIKNLYDVYLAVSNEYCIPIGDFPPLEIMQKKINELDWNKIIKLDSKRIEILDHMLSVQIPQLMKLLPSKEIYSEITSNTKTERSLIYSERTPFMQFNSNSDNNVYQYGEERFLKHPPDVSLYAKDFSLLCPDEDGKVSGENAKVDLIKSKLSSSVLHRIWNLADITSDGYLDIYEYALARTFIQMKLEGFDLPKALPSNFLNNYTLINKKFADSNNDSKTCSAHVDTDGVSNLSVINSNTENMSTIGKLDLNQMNDIVDTI